MLTLYQVGSYHYQTMDNDATGNKSDTKHKCQLRKHICAPKFEVKKMPDNSNRVIHHQGGRQEFEIGVAYNKVGQKYPNKDILEASRQKAR